MSVFINPSDRNVFAAFEGRASGNVTSAIHNASLSTGVDFAYLMQQANVESGFDADAKASTSSASGLYQFIDSTWLSLVEKHGDKYGIDPNASKKDILKLRNDPELASNMAAELALDNEDFLKNNWGGDVGHVELYLAHFLGAGGASSFLNARDENPMRMAADLFPAAARSNRNIFYDKASGQGRTLEEVYALFDKKFDLPDTSGAKEFPQVASSMPAAANQKSANEMLAYNILTRPAGGGSPSSFGYQSLVMSPVQVMMMAELEMPFSQDNDTKFF